jgi:PAS domain S-box-containing protein/diguanylate cyclase (GGDEF)-like protein
LTTALLKLDPIQQAIVSAAVDAIIISDAKGRILYFSPSAESLFGYSAKEVTGVSLNMLMPASEANRHDGYMQKYQRTGQAAIIGKGRDVQGKRKDGSEFPMHLSVGKTEIDGQTIFVGICHDLSDYRAAQQSQQQLSSLQDALFDAAVDGIICIDEQGLILAFNSGAERLFGYCRDEVLGKNVKILMPAKQAYHHDGYIQEYLRSKQPKVIGIGRDVKAMRKDGSTFPLHLSVGEAKSDSGPRFVGVCHDLTEYQQLMQQLSRAERRYKDIIQYQKEFICRLSTSLRLSFVNNAFCQQLGYSQEEVVGVSVLEFVHQNERSAVESLLSTLHQEPNGQSVSVVATMQGSDGRFYNIDWTFRTLPASSEFQHEIQAIGMDITEQEKAKRHAHFLAQYDSLTGLYNKEGLTRAFSELTDKRQPYALFFTDCQRFRLINEKYGHDVGDLMLMEAAQRLKQCVPENSLLCRPGADDFVLISPLKDETDLFELGRELLNQLTRPYNLAGERVAPSANLGISVYPDDADRLDILMRQAESAMFEAKSSNQPIRLFHQDIHHHLTRTLEIEQGIKRALEQDLFELALQPKFQLEDMSLCGYEALLRWNDPILGTVRPDIFIAIAERVNLGKIVDAWVLDKVFEQVHLWRQRGYNPKPVAINITASHFADTGLFDLVKLCARTHDVPLDCIALEITEGAAMGNSPVIIDNLRAFRQQGVKVAIDDFGTGYSSLGYLKDLPVALLKIDKVFVQELENPRTYGLVNAMIAMADAVGLEVLAEGIETERQCDILKRMGCDQGQGYLYAKPMSPEEIERSLV